MTGAGAGAADAGSPPAPKIAIIGFGEMGAALASGLLGSGAREVRVFDMKFADAADGARLRAAAQKLGATAADSIQAAIRDADIIISAVTAGTALAVAREASRFVTAGQVFLDLNSTSPHEKQAGADVVRAAGAEYVEAAVLGPIGPHGHKVPMLAAGEVADALAIRLGALGMALDVAGKEIGSASAVKMCRSIIMKGMEALTVECFCAARHYGVEEQVLKSLARTYRGFDWEERAPYMLGRVFAHAARRAEEMRAAAETVTAAGLRPVMTSAIAERQQWVADLAPAPPRGEVGRIDVASYIDSLLAASHERAEDG